VTAISDPNNFSEIKKDERSWQDRQGGDLQIRSYERPGTQVVINGQYARVAEALQLSSGMRLLDLGCGAGLFLGWIAPRVKAECHGLDLSLTSLKINQERNSGLGLTVGDAELLPYQDASFDRISCNGAAHHLLNLRTALREVYRVLSPGGRIVMYEPSATMLANAVRKVFLSTDKYESPADLAHKDEFTCANVETILLEEGFGEISTSFHDFLAYPLSGMYIDLPLSKSRTAMQFLTRFEGQVERWSILKKITNLFAWRLLVVASKPTNNDAKR
jgi:SAM-dependent methyltransferase